MRVRFEYACRDMRNERSSLLFKIKPKVVRIISDHDSRLGIPTPKLKRRLLARHMGGSDPGRKIRYTWSIEAVDGIGSWNRRMKKLVTGGSGGGRSGRAFLHNQVSGSLLKWKTHLSFAM